MLIPMVRGRKGKEGGRGRRGRGIYEKVSMEAACERARQGQQGSIRGSARRRIESWGSVGVALSQIQLVNVKILRHIT
jgi:hypothetical protein